MIGLGDTTCTDDELDVLALCPSQGGTPDYVNCICSDSAVAAPVITTSSLSSYLPWILAAGVAYLFLGKGKQ